MLPSTLAATIRQERGKSPPTPYRQIVALINSSNVDYAPVSYGTVWRTHQRMQASDGETPPPTASSSRVTSSTYPRRAPTPKFKLPQPHIIKRPDHEHTDWGKYHKFLYQYESKHETMRLAHWTDIHYPFHDVAALELAATITHYYRPDMLPVGLDEFDLPSVSDYDIDPDLDLQLDDWIARNAGYHISHLNLLDAINPRMKKPYIPGNHDWRAWREIEKSSARRTLHKAWRDAVRQDGRVLWFGRIDYLDIGNAVRIMHKPSSGGQYQAAGTLRRNNYDRNYLLGHIHRAQYYSQQGAETSKQAWVTPCLSSLVPHYSKMKDTIGWQHGIWLGTVDVGRGVIQGHNYVFHHSDTEVYCEAFGKSWSVSKP